MLTPDGDGAPERVFRVFARQTRMSTRVDGRSDPSNDVEAQAAMARGMVVHSAVLPERG